MAWGPPCLMECQSEVKLNIKPMITWKYPKLKWNFIKIYLFIYFSCVFGRCKKREEGKFFLLFFFLNGTGQRCFENIPSNYLHCRKRSRTGIQLHHISLSPLWLREWKQQQRSVVPRCWWLTMMESTRRDCELPLRVLFATDLYHILVCAPHS